MSTHGVGAVPRRSPRHSSRRVCTQMHRLKNRTAFYPVCLAPSRPLGAYVDGRCTALREATNFQFLTRFDPF